MKSCPNNLLQRSFSCLSCFNSFGYNYWPYTLRQSHAQCLTSPLKAPLSRRRFRYLKSLLVAKKKEQKIGRSCIKSTKTPCGQHTTGIQEAIIQSFGRSPSDVILYLRIYFASKNFFGRLGQTGRRERWDRVQLPGSHCIEKKLLIHVLHFSSLFDSQDLIFNYRFNFS